MNYKLSIYRKEPNPNYASEMEEYQANNRGGYRDYNDSNRPQPFVSVDALLTELTQEQFDLIRKAVLENF